MGSNDPHPAAQGQDHTGRQPAAIPPQRSAAHAHSLPPVRRAPRLWHPPAFLAAAAGAVVASAGASSLLELLGLGGKRPVAVVGAALATILCYLAWKAAFGLITKWKTYDAHPMAVLAAIGTGVVALGLSVIGAFTTVMLASGTGFRGRQLRRRGVVLLPPVRADPAWARVATDVAVEPGVRAALAAQWRENGRTEHASVAAFARLTLDLMALGAPPALVADASRDALDEIRHTELCFSLASALDGQALSPGPFPEAQAAHTLPNGRTLALAKLAVDSLIDGALNEGFSARTVAQLARGCAVPAIKRMLKEIAADEWRHATHGWDVVAWCVEAGGQAVMQAVQGAAAALPRTARSQVDARALAGAWERYGLPGRALEAREFAKTRADVRRRVRMLAARRNASRLRAREALAA